MTRAPHVCTEPGCPNIVERSGRCQACRTKRNAARRKIDYGPNWPAIRARYRQRHPDCERCGKPGAEVHHRDERGGEPASNRDDNLETLCAGCHGKQTLQPFAKRDTMRKPRHLTPPRGPSASRPVVGGGLLDLMMKREDGPAAAQADDDDLWPDVSAPAA